MVAWFVYAVGHCWQQYVTKFVIIQTLEYVSSFT